MIATHRSLAALVYVSCMAERGGNFFQVGLLSYRQHIRCGINFRGVCEHRTFEALVDNPFVLHIHEREEDDESERKKCEAGENETEYRVTEAAFASVLTSLPMRDSEFDSHVNMRRVYASRVLPLMCAGRAP